MAARLKARNKPNQELSFHSLFTNYSVLEFGTRLAEIGCDAFTIAQLLGHSDVRVTMRYVRTVEKSKRAAVEALCSNTFTPLALQSRQRDAKNFSDTALTQPAITRESRHWLEVRPKLLQFPTKLGFFRSHSKIKLFKHFGPCLLVSKPGIHSLLRYQR